MKYFIIIMLVLMGCGKETSTSSTNTGSTSSTNTTEKKICSIICKERDPSRGYCLEEVFECEDI